MAKPASRTQLVDYCLRKLGAPVLEINVDDDQIDDLVDDAIQLFNERHFDGVERMYLKYQFTQDDIDRGSARSDSDSTNTAGIVTTTGTSTAISGYGTTTTSFVENSNFIQVPDSVIGIEKIFKFDTQVQDLFKLEVNTYYNSQTAYRQANIVGNGTVCLLYTSPSPRDGLLSRMPSSA